MYSYNAQKVLHDERIRELLTDAQPHESKPTGRLLSLLSSLRAARRTQREPKNSPYALAHENCVAE